MSKLGVNIIKIVLLVVLIIAIIFSVSYLYIFNKVEVQLKSDVGTCVVEAAKVIDVDKLDKIITNKLKNAPEPDEILNSMLLFKANQNVKNLYIFTKQDDKTALFVIDASPLKDIMIGIEGILSYIHSASNSLSDISYKKTIIVNNLENSSAPVEEISASSEEIAASSEVLTASTEQVADAAEKLAHMMDTVTNSINKFKTI